MTVSYIIRSITNTFKLLHQTSHFPNNYYVTYIGNGYYCCYYQQMGEGSKSSNVPTFLLRPSKMLRILNLFFLLTQMCYALFLLQNKALTDQQNELIKVFPKLTNALNSENKLALVANEDTKYVADLFLKHAKNSPRILLNREFGIGGINNFSTRAAYIVFLKDLDGIEGQLGRLPPFYLFSNKDKLVIVICSKVEDAGLLKKVMVYPWERKRILNFALVCYYNQAARIISWNPFSETLSFDAEDIFDDKLSNFHGHQMNVSLFNYPPRTVVIGDKFYGIDIMVLERIAWQLNATVKLLPAKDNFFFGGADDVRAERSEFILAAGYMYHIKNYGNQLETGYPYYQDNCVVLAPKAAEIPEYQRLFQVFSLWVWIGVVSTVVSGMFLFELYDWLEKSDGGWLEILRMVLASSSLRLENAVFSKKLIIILMILFSMIIDSGFDSSLTSALITPKYLDGIKNIQDLSKSGLKLGVLPEVKAMLEDNVDIPFNYVVYSNALSLNQQIVNDTSGAIAYTKPTANAYFYTKLTNVMRKREVYRILPQPIMNEFSALLFGTRCPYTEKFNKLVQRDKEHGFFDSPVWEYKLSRKTLQDALHLRMEEREDPRESRTMPLNVLHLQAPLYMLGIGYVLSFVVFVTEILWNKMHHKL